MTIQRLLTVLLVGFMLGGGCTAVSHPDTSSGCAPGQTRIEDENTGTFDCASEKDYEDIQEHMDQGRHQ